MKRTVWLWELFGFAFVSLGGTILHFLYDRLGNAVWIAPFSGVNESTWEHMKLMFWPILIYAVFQSLFFRHYEGFWCIKLRGTLIALGLIPLIFYTYNGVIGKSPDFVNITIFFVSAAVAFFYEIRAFSKNKTKCRSEKLAIALLLLIAFSFVLFTFNAPGIDIFKDPISGGFGI